MTDGPLWRPSEERVRASNMARFIAALERDSGVRLDGYRALHRFSIAEPEKFWTGFKAFAEIKAETWGGTVLANRDKMPGATWFPDSRLNFAENLLRRRDDGDAIVFLGENGVRRRLSHAELYEQVSRVAAALKADGVGPGDRVAGFVANMPEAVIGMLAAASIGAIWSSCSPDFGVQGVLDRFGQIEPKVLFAVEGYAYNGKTIDCLPRIAEVASRLPSVVRTVIVPYTRAAPDIAAVPNAAMWDAFIEGHAGGDIAFRQMPFNQPLYILYSSGTTGAPKCIVHGAGGTLLQHMKEHMLHCDVKPGDRTFYFTTCGWMMWNWLVSALSCGATLLLYDGAPFHPDGNTLFDFIEAENATLCGISAKFIDAAAKAGLEPGKTRAFPALRLITSTGSPLAPEGFDFVYEKVKRDVHLASIAGGTDIVSCFVIGNPMEPVWRGEIQGPGLGMAVDVFDDEGRALPAGKGELVCIKPFPAMPVGFWNDPEGKRYRAAYFERFPNVWCHGDYVAFTEHGGLIIYGRSDATLNPGGVRIGTAEIYRQVETLEEIVESIVVGQEWQNDVRVVLFVVLRPGLTLDKDLVARIKDRIRANCTPRHVPARIVQIADIPRTKSGKITELAVRDTIHGRAVKNREALANPQALDLYKDLPELQS